MVIGFIHGMMPVVVRTAAAAAQQQFRAQQGVVALQSSQVRCLRHNWRTDVRQEHGVKPSVMKRSGKWSDKRFLSAYLRYGWRRSVSVWLVQIGRICITLFHDIGRIYVLIDSFAYPPCSKRLGSLARTW